MTTNVYDIPAGLLTSDCRWSRPEGKFLIYVDDTGFDKIVHDDQLAILFAGAMEQIDIWKEWFAKGRPSPSPLQSLAGISMIIIDVADGSIPFKTDYLLSSSTDQDEKAWYGGSGAGFAKDCWDANKCAHKAVESAKSQDICTGGNITHFNRLNLETNVSNNTSYSQVFEQLKVKGMIMDTTDKVAVPLAVAANDGASEDMKEIAKKALCGKIALSAPFPGMTQPWTKEKTQELENVLSRYSAKK